MYLAIRRATDEDVDNVLRVTKESFSLYQEELHVNYEVKALKETIESTLHDIRENAVFVVERFGTLVGAIRIKKLSDDLWYVYRFGVSPKISNTGLGSALLDAAVNYAHDNGAKAIALHTNSKYYRLARYYYGKQFFVHSTTFDRGYVRALFVLELEQDAGVDLSPAFLQ
ncbi:MAG: GNAT family N-acetyltransferase [Clostridiales bacterium]|nr:GNAT family N-acetyltransferase [Clostridiales bacterium]